MREWRRYVEAAARAVEEILPGAEVYVIGGAAEGRLTVLSDVDVLIATSRRLSDQERRRLKADIIWAAGKYGLQWDYPVDLHIIHESGMPHYKRRARRMMPIRARPQTPHGSSGS